MQSAKLFAGGDPCHLRACCATDYDSLIGDYPDILEIAPYFVEISAIRHAELFRTIGNQQAEGAFYCQSERSMRPARQNLRSCSLEFCWSCSWPRIFSFFD